MRLHVFAANLVEARQWIELHGLDPQRVGMIGSGPSMLGISGTVIMVEGWSRNRDANRIVDELRAQHAKGYITCMTVATELFGFSG